MEIIYLVVFLLVGMFAGIGSGLIGIGGGIIYIPFLYFLLPLIGVTSSKLIFIAIVTSHFTALFSSGSGLVNHIKLKNVDFALALLLGSGSFVTAFVIPLVFIKLDPNYSKVSLLFFLFLIIIRMLLEMKNIQFKVYNFNRLWLIFIGFIIGAVASSAGIGGGIFVVPILTYLFSVPFKRSIGTSTFAVFITIFISSISYWVANFEYGLSNSPLGLINLHAAIPMAVGAIIGGTIGAKLGHRISEKSVKIVFLTYLILATVKIASTL